MAAHQAAAIFAAFLVFFFLSASILSGQTQPLAEPSVNVEQQRILELKKLQLALASARATLESSQNLYQAGVIPATELDRAKLEYQQSEINFQQAFLQLFSDVPRITLVGALKLQEPDGKRLVRLTLRNVSSVTLDYKAFGIDSPDVPIPSDLKLREITNVIVSLREYDPAGSLGPIISRPYEIIIPVLAAGRERRLQFELLKDVDVVTVWMNYAGKTDQREVQLEKDASANIVTVTSATFSQEADLGAQATFDLALEQFTRVTNSFKLIVLNLPSQINYEFVEPATNARLSQVRFPEGVTSLKLQLRLSLPDQAGDIALDHPFAFWVLVADPMSMPAAALHSEQEIRAVRAGKVLLELIPRGVGKLEVSAPVLYQEIKPGERTSLGLVVKNTGTRRIQNVKVSADNPIDWRTEISPTVIPVLEPFREEMVSAVIIPPPDVGVGDYEVRIKTEAMNGGRKIQSEDKINRVHVTGAAGMMSILVLGGILVVVFAGIILLGVKVSRR